LRIDDALARCKQGVDLSKYTTWQIGGPAEYFAEPESIQELVDMTAAANEAGVPIMILGRGSNTLIESSGVPGITICLKKCLQTAEFREADGTFYAEAGCPMPTLATLAGKHKVGGFEFLIGIPGTIGAGVAINAGIGGADGTGIDTVLKSALLFEHDSGRVFESPLADMELSYRHSNLPDRRIWVLAATFDATHHDDPKAIAERRRAILDKRSAKQPLNKRTSGSVFKQVPADVPGGGKAAGWYSEQAGMKGKQRGGAMVSPKHGNWIENVGNATSQDVKDLIQEVIDAVHAKFGVTLEREVRYLPAEAR